MSDTYNPLNPLSGGPLSFLIGGNQATVNQALRQRIALAMMSKQRPLPKTFGEGLAAIGQALGEQGMAKSLMDADLADQAAIAGITPPGATTAPAPTPIAAAPTASDQTTVVKPPETVGANEYNYMDAGADAPKPGSPGITPANYANVRYNNPGAAWPSPEATTFGSTGSGVIGGGNKIAQFPSPVHGAAANMALLDRNYTGMPISAAVSKWSGGGRSTVPGFDPSTVITKEMMRDPKFAVPFAQALAGGEAPGRYPMSDDQWQMAHQWFTQGGVPGQGGPRDQIASTLAANAQMPPQAGTQFAALTPRDTASDIQTAPPMQPQLRTEPPPQQAAVAPPPTQVAQAQGTGAPPPQFGYVRPPVTEPTAPTPQPLHPWEAWGQQIMLDSKYRNNPYAAQQVAPYVAEGKRQREAADKAAQEKYQSDLALSRTQTEARQKEIADQAKDIAQGQKLQQDLQQLTEPQTKALIAHTWASQANGVLKDMKNSDQLLAEGYTEELKGRIPFLGNKALQDDYRRAKNAADTFILAFMRSTSGAAYGEKERLDHAYAMLPKLGDDAKTLADKAAQREAFVRGEYAATGPVGQRHADTLAKDLATSKQAATEKQQEQQASIDAEMKGVTPTRIGQIKYNRAEKKARQWNGQHWIEVPYGSQ